MCWMLSGTTALSQAGSDNCYILQIGIYATKKRKENITNYKWRTLKKMRVSQAEPFLIPTRYRSALNSLVLTTRHSASSLALRCKKTRTLQKVCPPPRPTHLAHFASCTRVFSLPAFPAALYHQSILERLKIGFKVGLPLSMPHISSHLCHLITGLPLCN